MSVLRQWTKTAGKCFLGSCNCIGVSKQNLDSLRQLSDGTAGQRVGHSWKLSVLGCLHVGTKLMGSQSLTKLDQGHEISKKSLCDTSWGKEVFLH